MHSATRRTGRWKRGVFSENAGRLMRREASAGVAECRPKSAQQRVSWLQDGYKGEQTRN
jgi:hypothetical protein